MSGSEARRISGGGHLLLHYGSNALLLRALADLRVWDAKVWKVSWRLRAEGSLVLYRPSPRGVLSDAGLREFVLQIRRGLRQADGKNGLTTL